MLTPGERLPAYSRDEFLATLKETLSQTEIEQAIAKIKSFGGVKDAKQPLKQLCPNELSVEVKTGFSLKKVMKRVHKLDAVDKVTLSNVNRAQSPEQPKNSQHPEGRGCWVPRDATGKPISSPATE